MEVSSIIQPDIYVVGLRIMEPMTSATNLLISGICFYGYFVLKKQQDISKTLIYMKWYFLCMGIGAFLGGIIGHAFLYLLGNSWRILGWLFGMVAVMLVERAAIEHARKLFKPMVGKVLMVLNLIELVIFMSLAIATVNFRFVQIHALYGYICFVFGLHAFIYYKTKDKSSIYIFYAIGSLFFSVYIFNKPLVLHEWFNHRDFAHLFMAFASYLLLKSTLNLNKTAD